MFLSVNGTWTAGSVSGAAPGGSTSAEPRFGGRRPWENDAPEAPAGVSFGRLPCASGLFGSIERKGGCVAEFALFVEDDAELLDAAEGIDHVLDLDDIGELDLCPYLRRLLIQLQELLGAARGPVPQWRGRTR
jgi:hypothetical protein